MLYLVGGCSRSGKSLLAGRVRAHYGVPCFPLDALTMGRRLGAPSPGIHPNDDDLETADRTWPIIKGVRKIVPQLAFSSWTRALIFTQALRLPSLR
jgi:hypothetical protein